MSASPGTESHPLCQWPHAIDTATPGGFDDEHDEQQQTTHDMPGSSIERDYQQPQSISGEGYGPSVGTLATDARERLLANDRDRNMATATPEPEKQAHTKLHRSTYIVFIVIIYAAVSIFAWVVTCILAFRPMPLQHYGVWLGEDGMGPGIKYNRSWKFITQALYQQSETWFQTARVLQSIVSILTIPVASAVCGSAAVVYAQRGRCSKDLSLGQLVLLADKTWSDPLTILKLVFGKLTWKTSRPGISHNRRSYASTLLVLAILLHLLGSIIAPLQQVLLGSTTLHVPTGPDVVVQLTDLPNQQHQEADAGGAEWIEPDSNIVVLMTRAAIETAINLQTQAQLWPGANIICDANDVADSNMQYFCGRGAILGDMSKLHDPFLAELPSSFHTGLIRQFIPRINSTATYEQIPETEFPRGCEKTYGAFYVDYWNTTKSSTETATWGLQACMPNNNTISPWKFNRDRQGFKEQLYLNITLAGFYFDTSLWETPTTSYVKITLETTAGYFELPNYMNHGVAGPLLDKDPFTSGACDNECVNGTSKSSSPFVLSHSNRREKNNSYDQVGLERVPNKGPLLTTAMALFGSGSFPQTRLANPEAFGGTPYPPEGAPEMVVDAQKACNYILPLAALVQDIGSNGNPEPGDTIRGSCIFNSEGDGGPGVHREVARWLRLFTNFTEPERLSNAFTAAAFIANQNWLLNQASISGGEHLDVYYDKGTEIQAIVISKAGIITVSSLLGLYLVALLGLAVYATWTPRWTRTLDSFAMMRIGAVYQGHFPLNVGSGIHDVEEVQRLSGTVGAVGGNGATVRRLELGAKGRVGPGEYLKYTPISEMQAGEAILFLFSLSLLR